MRSAALSRAPQALAEPTRIGKFQGVMHGATLGLANGAFLGAYALALWFGSARVQAGAMTGALRHGALLAVQPDTAEVVCLRCTSPQATEMMRHAQQYFCSCGRLFTSRGVPAQAARS